MRPFFFLLAPCKNSLTPVVGEHRFIQLFFHRFQTLIPILHAPTFDANTCPSYLVLSVAAIGSRYAYDFNKGSAIFANTLSDLSVRLLQHTVRFFLLFISVSIGLRPDFL